jgi:hypothetical protein
LGGTTKRSSLSSQSIGTGAYFFPPQCAPQGKGIQPAGQKELSLFPLALPWQSTADEKWEAAKEFYMNETAMQKEITKAKKWNLIIFGVFVVIFVVLIMIVCMYQYQHSYTRHKWDTDKENRYKIVSDMLEQYQLVGMTEAEVIQLLGNEDSSDKTSFKISKGYYPPESTLVYWLGVDFMDDNWLVISLDDHIVTDYCIDLT